MSTAISLAPARRSWIPLWIITLLFIFEADLRSVGLAERTLPISVGLVKGFWLGDLGLLLPVIALFVAGRGDRLFRGKTMRWVVAIWSCGAVIAVLRHNQFSPFAYDLRISLALLTGLSLVACAPRDMRALAHALVLVSAAGVILAWIILVEMPSSGMPTLGGERITAESAFLLIGPPIVLLGPAIVLATMARLRRLTLVAWLTGVALLLEIVVLLQTRSLAVSVVLALALARAATVALTGLDGFTPEMLRERTVIGKGTALLMVILFAAAVLNRTQAVAAFFARMASGVHLATDTTWLIRAAEVVEVFSSMSPLDHLTGLGLGPTPHLNVLQLPVFSLHVGVLNVWWRFGVVIFFLLLWAEFYLAKQWLAARRRLMKRRILDKRDVALVAVVPGVLALAAQAFISGGWAITSMLALGIAWGVYRALSEGHTPWDFAPTIEVLSDSVTQRLSGIPV